MREPDKVTPFESEPSLEMLLSNFDAADQGLLIQYARYIEFSSEKRRLELNGAMRNLRDVFMEILQIIVNGSDPDLDNQGSNTVLAILLSTMDSQHTILLNEFVDTVEVKTEVESQRDRRKLIESFEETALIEESEEYIEHAIECFEGILEQDDEIVDQAIAERNNRISRKLLREIGVIAKTAAGAAVGVYVLDKLRATKSVE